MRTSAAFLAVLPLVISSVAVAQCDTESQKLLPEVAQAHARFGRAVAISGDTLFVGSPSAAGGGAVFVYESTPGGWVRGAVLVGDSRAAGFGWALSVDAETLVVGAPYTFSYHGAAYVFERAGDAWRRTRRLSAAVTGQIPEFGQTVSIDADTIAVGVYGDAFTGSVRTFVRQGAGWVDEATIWNPDLGFFEAFGVVVALDGDTLAVTEGTSVGANNKIYHFRRNSGVWTEATGLLAIGFARIAIDDDWLVVGDGPGARVLLRQGDSWSAPFVLDSPDRTMNDGFGDAVSIEGNRVVIGAPKADAGRGAVYVFERSGSTWNQVARFTASDVQVSDEFGSAVAQFGETVVAGVELDNAGALDSGSSYVLDVAQPATPFCDAGPTSLGEPAVLTANGCRSILHGDLRFVVSPVPQTRAILTYGPDAIQQPFGNSFQCVGGALTRAMGTYDGAQRISWGLDLDQPQHDRITVGSTWFFQAAFRDPAAGGIRANLSNALEITFTP